LLLSILSLFTFWQVLSFDFFQDDYFFLWNALHDPFVQFINFRHPGTPLEALLLGHLFGQNAFLWELLGIVLKIIVAYLTGIFLYKLTKSKVAGFLAGIFSAATIAGMYVVNAFNFHLPALVAIFLLLSLIYLCKSIKENEKYFWKFILFLIPAILLDPARGLPVILLLPYFFILFPKSKKLTLIKKYLKNFFFLFFVIGIPLLGLWYIQLGIGQGTQFELFLKGLKINPHYTIGKIKFIGNFFATVANLFTEVVYGLRQSPPKYETAYYTRTFGLMGIGLFLFGIAGLFYGIRKKSHFFISTSFFILWTFLFYFPNWLAEPRTAMTSQSHYLFLSDVGFICLVAYLLSRMKNKWLVIFFSLCFVILNIYRVKTTLSQEFPYRSRATIEKVMHQMLKNVPKNEKNDIFLLSGNENWLYYSIMYWGNWHVMLLRGNTSVSELPEMTFDDSHIIIELCKGLPLSHVYSWKAISPGVIVDKSAEERKILLENAKNQCSDADIQK